MQERMRVSGQLIPKDWLLYFYAYVKKQEEGMRTMTARFMSNTPYAGTKFEMQRIPGFRPRRSGMSVSRFESRTHGCVCPCERLLAGCAPVDELLDVLTRRGGRTALCGPRVTPVEEPIFRFFNDCHWRRFEAAYKENLTNFAGQTAAVFLLTVDPFLWSKSRLSVSAEGIAFSDIHIHAVDLDGYVLFHTAKDLYAGTKHITLSELADPELVSDEAFKLIVTAFLIRRYGPMVIPKETEDK